VRKLIRPGGVCACVRDNDDDDDDDGRVVPCMCKGAWTASLWQLTACGTKDAVAARFPLIPHPTPPSCRLQGVKIQAHLYTPG
jgi:hypothetical protein